MRFDSKMRSKPSLMFRSGHSREAYLNKREGYKVMYFWISYSRNMFAYLEEHTIKISAKNH